MIERKISVEGIEIENVERFTYLGSKCHIVWASIRFSAVSSGAVRFCVIGISSTSSGACLPKRLSVLVDTVIIQHFSQLILDRFGRQALVILLKISLARKRTSPK